MNKKTSLRESIERMNRMMEGVENGKVNVSAASQAIGTHKANLRTIEVLYKASRDAGKPVEMPNPSDLFDLS